jgi:hypothetical protein
MAKRTLFAYVQGADLEDVVEALETRFDALAASRTWVSKDVWVVNQRELGDPPAWDLGLNLALSSSASGKNAAEWIDDVVAIAVAFGQWRRETGRSFVIGISDDKAGTTKDLFFIDSDEPDLEKLRATCAEVGK